jgi:hypothetical protein
MTPAVDPLADRDVDGLLPLAVARPRDALARARAVLAADLPPLTASTARQAIGIVLRDRGDMAAAVGELRRALRLARVAGSPARKADVQAPLGTALGFAAGTCCGSRGR